MGVGCTCFCFAIYSCCISLCREGVSYFSYFFIAMDELVCWWHAYRIGGSYNRKEAGVVAHWEGEDRSFFIQVSRDY